MKKDLEYFKQQVAEKYGFTDINLCLMDWTSRFVIDREKPDRINPVNEAAELYAQHCAEIAREEERNGFVPLVDAANNFIEKVDMGRARSVDSYNKFKKALQAVNPKNVQRKTY